MWVTPHSVRLVIANCQVDYAGRLTAHLPMATRLILVKNDGSVSSTPTAAPTSHQNWMSPPCRVVEGTNDDGVVE